MKKEVRKIFPADFPPLLREINDPPKALYITGSLPPFERKFLCVVGSRKNTAYGKDACEKLISGLSGLPIVIVSGLAFGIDSIAHRAALSSGLITVAIPGSGLNPDILYPALNKNLADKIIDAGGALISEFEQNFKATPWSFPKRNRLMAGMSHATLVIEAEKKSGTLITARLATEYNRDVLTVPGSIFSANTEGPHLLLRLGATPITNSDDLKEALGFARSSDHLSTEALKDCSAEEKVVLEMLREPHSRDELIQELNLSAREVSAILSIMEIKGLIIERMGEIHRA